MIVLFIQVAAVFSMIALVYMRIFLEESLLMKQPLLKEQQCEDVPSQRTTGTFKKLPSLGDVICLLKCRYVYLALVYSLILWQQSLNGSQYLRN